MPKGIKDEMELDCNEENSPNRLESAESRSQ